MNVSGSGDPERERLIAAVTATEAELQRTLARGQSPLFDSGLTMQQLRVLLLLGADGPHAQSELAQALAVGLATVTGLVDRLVRRGLVARTRDPQDRRVHRAALSDEGRDLLAGIQSAGQERRRRLLGSIDIDALRGLAIGLDALRAALEADIR
ncbi:MarR family winged helix-turn-helix transcriptional regulator [Pseudonocardia sp. GCM10023141]|uniref:MarR family winged helix-turn-helix transcriptional regulator n=1 Tax=Pseudonocardia sp. GCM10023141 TaxID=3252653 RepID=UPI003612A070